MKKALIIPLLALSGCGISTYKSDTQIEKETTYVPVSIKEQILGYTQGSCTDGTFRQRFFSGAAAFADNGNSYLYQYRLIHNLDGTYDLKTRTFKGDIENSPPSFQSGTYEIVGQTLSLENMGPIRVELGSRGSRIKFDVTTPYGDSTVELNSAWLKDDINNNPFCP